MLCNDMCQRRVQRSKGYIVFSENEKKENMYVRDCVEYTLSAETIIWESGAEECDILGHHNAVDWEDKKPSISYRGR